MAATQRKLVHKQFNSPIGMYSDDNVKETLDRELKALSSGVIGIDFNEPTIPANLRNSAVLRMLEEQEHEKATEIAKMRKSRSRCRAIIDRETVLKLNRRHKRRDYSWPPHSEFFGSSRSRSSSNEIHFDEKVCKRNEISHLRQMFDEGTIFEKGSQYRSLSEDRNHVKDKMTGKSQEKHCSDTRKCNLKDIKGNNESQGVNNESEKNNSTKRGVGTKWPQGQQTDNIFASDTGYGACIGSSDNASLANKTFHLPKGSLHFEEIEKVRKYFEEASSQKHHSDRVLKKWKSHESLCEMKATQDKSFISDNSKYLQRYKSNSYNELLPPQKPKRHLHKNLSHPTSNVNMKNSNVTETSKIDVHLSTTPKSDSNSSNNSNIRKTAIALEINVKPSSIKEACIKVEQPTLTAEWIDPQVKVSRKIHGETLLTSGANFTDNCLQSNNLTSKRDKTMKSIINNIEPITHDSSNNRRNNEMFDGVSYDEHQLYISDSSYSDSCGTAKSIINDSNFYALSKMATFKHPVESSGTSDTKKTYETKLHSNESYYNILPLINENVNITFAISQANDGKDDNDKTNYIFDKNSKNTPTSEYYAIERNGVMKNFCNLQTHPPEIGTPHSELKLNEQQQSSRQPCVGRPKPPPRRMTVLFSDDSSTNLNDRNIKLNNVRKILTEPKNIEVPPILSPDVNVEPTSGIWFCCRKQNENDDLKTNDEKCDFRMKDNRERAMSLYNPITSKTRNSDYVFLTPSTNVQRKETDNLDGKFTFSPWDNSQFDTTTEINVNDLLMSTQSDGIVPGSFERSSKDTARNFFLCDEYLRKCEKSILDAERHLENSVADMGSSMPLYQSKPPTSDQSTLTGFEYTPIVEQVLFDLYNFSKILDTMQERCLQHTKHDNYITARIFEISDSKSYNEDVDSKYSESDTTATTSQSNSPPKQIHADEIIQSKNILSGYLVSKQNQEEVLKQALNLIETSKARGHVVIDLHDEGLNVSPCFIPEIRIISPVSVEHSITESSSSPERIVSNLDESESDVTLETSKSFDVYTFDNALQDNFPSQRYSAVEQQSNADTSQIITQSKPISSNTSQTNVKQANDVNNKQDCKSRETENDPNATTITIATATTPDALCNNTLTNSTKTNSIRIIIQMQESTMNSRYQLQSKDHYCRSSESDKNIVTSNVKNQLLGAMDNNLKNDNDIQYDEKCIIENAARHAVGNRRKFHRNDAVESGYKVRSLSQPSRSTVSNGQCDRNTDVVPWRRQHHMEHHEVSVERDVDTDKSQHQRIYPLQRQHSFDSSESRYYASPRLYYTGYCEQTEGYKKVRWPPTDAHYVKGSTPQPSSYPPQQSEQGSGEHYPQQTDQPQYSQRPNQPQRPADHYPYQQQNTYQQQPQHQHANQQPYYQNPQSNPYSAQHQQPNTPYNQHQQQQHLTKEPANSTVSFSGGIPVNKPATVPEPNYQPSQYQPLQNYQHPTPNQQYQAQNTQNRVPQPQHYSPQQQSPNVSTLSPSYQPSAPTYPQSPRAPSPKGWHHVEAYSPARPGYTQPYQYQSGAPASVGSERDLGSYKQQNEYQSRHYYDYDPSVSQYQTPHHQQPTQYFQQHHRQFNKSENYSQEPALQQTNKPYAPPHQGYVPLQNQNGRGQSPGFITLRKEAPVSQDPAPIYTSQPAATTYKGGCNMRGDLKWPPPEYKAQAAAENEERVKLAKQPATRPLRVKKDYSSFFAKHALNSTYPAYKAPPGTQHYPEYAQY